MAISPLAMVGVGSILVLASGTSAAKETDWWRTTGGAVVEYNQPDHGEVCSLFLYNQDDASVVTWLPSQPAGSIAFLDQHWHFQPGQTVAVGVAIGDTWLTGPQPDAAALSATAGKQQITVSLRQPIEPLLQHASSITLRLGDRETTFGVNRRRMKALLRAVGRCRSALRRRYG